MLCGLAQKIQEVAVDEKPSINRRTTPKDIDKLTSQAKKTRADTVILNHSNLPGRKSVHCHVYLGPRRTEEMDAGTPQNVIEFLSASGAGTLDITGGAPELNVQFRYLVREARDRGIRIIDRCNLTILVEPGRENLADFLASYHVEVVASLPCYLEENVDAQRGKGVFAASIDGLRTLNRLGYGETANGLSLDLVYNSQGPSLPPPQQISPRYLGEVPPN